MGSTRYRKSIGLGKGVKLNVGKSGVTSVSFGVPGLRYTVGKGGRRTTTVSGGGFSKSSTTRSSASRQPVQMPAPPKPGFLAPAQEKAFYQGIQAYLAADWADSMTAFQTAFEKAKGTGWLAPRLFAALVSIQTNDTRAAIEHLEFVVRSEHVLPDGLTTKYAGHLSIPIPITSSATVRFRFGSLGAAMLLIELYQETGRREDAIGLCQQLLDSNPDSAPIRLSLADLLFEDGDLAGVVETAEGVTNDDDVTLSILHLKAQALLTQELTSAAISEFTGALKKTSGRDQDILRAIRYDRAAAYEAAGQVAKAKADWQKVYADAPRFRDVAERVGAVPSSR